MSLIPTSCSFSTFPERSSEICSAINMMAGKYRTVRPRGSRKLSYLRHSKKLTFKLQTMDIMPSKPAKSLCFAAHRELIAQPSFLMRFSKRALRLVGFWSHISYWGYGAGNLYRQKTTRIEMSKAYPLRQRLTDNSP